MQGGVRLVVETHMQEFSGKRQRFPENGVQDSRSVGGQIHVILVPAGSICFLVCIFLSYLWTL